MNRERSHLFLVIRDSEPPLPPSLYTGRLLQKSHFTKSDQRLLNFAFLYTHSMLELRDGNQLRKIDVFAHSVKEISLVTKGTT